jgi:hypothetical protein
LLHAVRRQRQGKGNCHHCRHEQELTGKAPARNASGHHAWRDKSAKAYARIDETEGQPAVAGKEKGRSGEKPAQ